MEPLDLTINPPRNPRETLLGAMFLPRTIDKLRAELPGGRLGEYVNHDRGASAFVVGRLGLNMDELREAVRTSRDEEELTEWLRPRLDPAVVDAANAKLQSLVKSRMKPDALAEFEERHPVLRERPELDNLLEILEAEDERLFAGAS
jgi:hypothetical protein